MNYTIKERENPVSSAHFLLPTPQILMRYNGDYCQYNPPDLSPQRNAGVAQAFSEEARETMYIL